MLVIFTGILLLTSCMMQGDARCTSEPAMIIDTRGGGSEDIAVLPMDQTGDITRLLIREICNDSSSPHCRPGQWRLGRVDISQENIPVSTQYLWRPGKNDGGDSFEPLGMSLIPGDEPGDGTLFVIDIGQPQAVRIWQLRIAGGKVADAGLATPVDTQTGIRLTAANSLQAIRDGDDFHLYVTRFDEYGLLPFRPKPWPALVQIREGLILAASKQDFRNANGIIAPCPDCDLVIASYWERRLRFASKDSGEIKGYASAELPIRPDNLRLDGERILIGGQHRVDLTALNLLVSSRIPSPSAVYAIDTQSLGPDATPMLLWEGGWKYGHSVATAVALPNNRLAIGQINTPGILVVDCPSGP
jgi:hypothetical protein